MKIFLLMVLWNVNTGQYGDVKVVKSFSDWESCAKVLNITGPQKIDGTGNAKLYACVKDGDRFPAQFTNKPRIDREFK